MVKKCRRLFDIRRNMPKAVLFFIFCVLLCEVSPKVPVRKEDLLNKKAALAKQLNPTVPKWDDLASKLHTKDKPNQNKSKTLMNMLKVVSAKEIDIPAADDRTNSTIDNSTLNTNITNDQNLKNNSVKSKPIYNNPFIVFKPQKHNSNATVAKTNKKYAANETIGGKLAYFLMKHAINTTKETPTAPDIIAPTMIPIFKPMPSSTRKTKPQPIANELIRKDNYVPKELNQQLLENLDDVELNINVFNPMQNKAVLNPLQATEDKRKENLPKDPHLKVIHPQNAMNQFHPIVSKEMEHNLNPAIHSPLQDGQTHILHENKTPENKHPIHPSDILLSYVDPQHTNINVPDDRNPYNKLTNIENPYQNIADNAQAAYKTESVQGNTVYNGVNQINFENIHPGMHHSAQPIRKQFELSISPPLQGNPTQAHNIELNPEFVLEKFNSDFKNAQYTPKQHEVLAQQNSFVINENPIDFPHPSMFVTNQHNNIIRNDIGINQDILNEFPANNNGVNHHPQQIVKDDSVSNKNIITPAQYAVHPNQINHGVTPRPEQNQGVPANTNLSPKNTGFSLPCLKASDVLEDLSSTAPCCQKGNAKLNSVTENPMSSLQCEKPLLGVKNDEDESVAIVFKPKNISLLKFYGDLLKKITLTVLVPYHITKLSPDN